MFCVRHIAEEDANEARDVWAEAMRSYDNELIDKFVQTRLDDPQDMGDIWNGFLKGSNSGNKGFWVVDYIENIGGEETKTHLPPKSDKHNVVKDNAISPGYLENCICVEQIETTSCTHKDLHDGEVYKIKTKRMIAGCVGCFVRSAEDLAKAIPNGKEYLNRDLGHASSDMQPLWAPVGVAGTLGDRSAAVELVRMAVHHKFRGMGVAELLVTAVAEYALSAKCTYVVLTTGSNMQKAVKAYKRLGFIGHKFPQSMVYAAKSHELSKIHRKSSGMR